MLGTLVRMGLLNAMLSLLALPVAGQDRGLLTIDILALVISLLVVGLSLWLSYRAN